MERIKKIVRLVEELDFDSNMKIILSLALTLIWLLHLTAFSRLWHTLVSQVITQEFLVTVTLPIFGFLYHKLFVLIDAKISLTELRSNQI